MLDHTPSDGDAIQSLLYCTVHAWPYMVCHQ